MRLQHIYTAFTSLLLLFCATLFTGYQDGSTSTGGVFVGAPGEMGATCGTCHSNPGAYGFVSIDIEMFTLNGVSTTSYIQGDSYDVVITINGEVGTPDAYGFQAVVLDDSDNNAGSISAESDIINIETVNGRLYAEQNTPSTSNVFTIRWKAPTSSVSRVTFYVAGTTVNLDGLRTGDSGTGTTPAKLSVTEDAMLASELQSFEATKSLNDVVLKWTTASEINSHSFIIEHADDGINFERIGQTLAAGNSTELRAYHYRHTQAIKGDNYYRLKEVELDGSTHHSEVIMVRMGEIHGDTDVFPNPVFDVTSVYIYNNEEKTSETELFIYSVSGQLINAQKTELKPGANTIPLNMNDLESGYYFIDIRLNEGKRIGEPLRVLKM